MIKVNDPIYGTFELPEIFDDLLNSKAMQRLGKIHHSGAVFLVNPDICHTRLEHSIGVMLLIRMLGGTELEQIAGLLHDISHTAFSHVGDYVF
ncbi:MAG TPA: HD domain-containing protein, partial [Pedobacter sp.]